LPTRAGVRPALGGNQRRSGRQQRRVRFAVSGGRPGLPDRDRTERHDRPAGRTGRALRSHQRRDGRHNHRPGTGRADAKRQTPRSTPPRPNSPPTPFPSQPFAHQPRHPARGASGPEARAGRACERARGASGPRRKRAEGASRPRRKRARGRKRGRGASGPGQRASGPGGYSVAGPGPRARSEAGRGWALDASSVSARTSAARSRPS
jgi:hypothetical protein